ncbi:hypothetical protein CDAR_319991 [Caerostris darwini]|uniref:Nucleoporin Nup153 N-terminal domain-containing protein n=1 Tax=Caerostris darwini TaxID=1538125 RepID=A0AAV4PUA2_9ARAC|nr:hypothetical protein CDAR_319991 [Caerostris darwini]
MAWSVTYLFFSKNLLFASSNHIQLVRCRHVFAEMVTPAKMDRRALRNKKSKSRSARPYDRPNQGILGKVASKVKGLFNPSWISSVSQWISPSEEQTSSPNTPEEESADEDVAPQTSSITSTSRGSKRPRLRLSPTLNEETQTWLETPPSSSLFSQSSHLPSTVTQNILVENKESSVIMNGDDHSENSEGSASTSGCSSLVSSHKERSNCLGPSSLRLSNDRILANLRGKNTINLKNRRDISSRKEGLSPNVNTSRMSTWSGSAGFSPTSNFLRRPPSVADANQPSFNVSAFATPSKVSPQVEKKVSSPFYQGRTTFGGASSSRRMPVSTAPYQVERPPRNQIKIRTNQSEDSLEGMSSAAKRILLTLEKMSSPVTDAKKMPNTNRSPVDLSLYLRPPKHRSNVVSTPVGTLKGPPIANISTISKLATLKSCRVKRFHNSTMESLPVPSLEKKKVIPDTSTQSDIFQIAKDKGGGKITNKLNQQHQKRVASSSLESGTSEKKRQVLFSAVSNSSTTQNSTPRTLCVSSVLILARLKIAPNPTRHLLSALFAKAILTTSRGALAIQQSLSLPHFPRPIIGKKE